LVEILGKVLIFYKNFHNILMVFLNSPCREELHEVLEDEFKGARTYGPNRHPIVSSRFMGGGSCDTRAMAGANGHCDGECIGPFSAFARRWPSATNEEIVSRVVSIMVDKVRARLRLHYKDGAEAIVHAYRADIISPNNNVKFDRAVPISRFMNWVYGDGDDGEGIFTEYDG
jgi:hypothetical protein